MHPILGLPLNILLIDDDESDILFIQKIIEKTPYPPHLHVMKDCTQLLHDLSTATPPAPNIDVILLDLNLPIIHGLQLLSQLKQTDTWSHIPVVILTGSSHPKDILSTYQNQAAGYIYKSFDINRFKQSLEGFISYWAHTTILPNRSVVSPFYKLNRKTT